MLSAQFALFEQFKSNLSLGYKAFIEHPYARSLRRFKQKILYNANVAPKNDHPGYFISLTLDEKHYGELTQQQAFSSHIRKYFTRLRNYLKRHNATFSYARRIERGSKNTQRLHIHFICHTSFPSAELQNYIKSSWVWCDWVALLKHPIMKKWFQPLNSSNLTNIYLTKYLSKNKSRKSYAGLIKTRSELACRNVSCSRDYLNLPRHLFMRYNKETKEWNSQIKNGFFPIPRAEIDEAPQRERYITENFYRPIKMVLFKNLPKNEIILQISEIIRNMTSGQVDLNQVEKNLNFIERNFKQHDKLRFIRKNISQPVQRRLLFNQIGVNMTHRLTIRPEFRLERKNNVCYFTFHRVNIGSHKISFYKPLLPEPVKKRHLLAEFV